eukprot:3612902-Rhodomonas_salina.1
MSTQRVDNSSSSSVKLLGYGLDSWVPPTWTALAVPYFYPLTAIKYGSSSSDVPCDRTTSVWVSCDITVNPPHQHVSSFEARVRVGDPMIDSTSKIVQHALGLVQVLLTRTGGKL